MREMYERFESFYSFNNLLRGNPGSDRPDKNLSFDSTRRFIDIVRFVNRRWPFSIPFISSCHGLSLWRPLFENFPADAANCTTLYEASVTRAAAVIRLIDGDFLSELISYEDFRNGSGIFSYSTDAVSEKTSVQIPYDLESFYLSLMFYGRASAPPFLYRQLDIEPGCTYRVARK
ncbi:hypothetical protein [Pseudomonas quasicaspiana]|uniref:hypothetical protein n=1 Tax=Pseudomonas quasicaspiana TaxID=2829821 RepID=UPI001E2D6058|nr:hypothetical protein [Pseudomonas quasicaspiana]MCD5974927.1 hypothetical protein [Pseudomonas quasicaspiana]